MRSSWKKSLNQEFDDFLRATAGAFLFGIPMLFTFEMWQVGSYLSDRRLAAFLVLAVLVNFPLAYFAGFKGESTFGSSIDQAVHAVAVGLAASAVVLVVLNRIQPGDSLHSTLGQIITQGVPLSLGASVANALMRRSQNPGNHKEEDESEPHPQEGEEPAANPWRDMLNDLGGAAAGGVFLGFSIAPTEEVMILALEMDYWHELALIGRSLLVAYVIVFESGFSPQLREDEQWSFLEHPATETLVTYVLSLLIAALALYLFGQIQPGVTLNQALSQILVLGLPTAVGGAAGRLVI